ncbi:MAG: hypothetical protein U9N73_00565 [Candidatus Auribacterota bacterium]|nr:hypothetical protein [Candidatus Auribacterota bacterium]
MIVRLIGLWFLAVVFIPAGNALPGTKDAGREARARIRMESFLRAVNENRPEKVYDYLLPSIQSLIDREGFVRNFARERSYPYLTPLYLYLEKLELDPAQSSGRAICRVAARLPGQTRVFPIIYTNENYFIDAFREIADGSFAEKFERLPIFPER